MTDPVQEELDKERREALEHRDVLLSFKIILATEHGRRIVKYLFKSLQVNELPAKGLDGMELHDTLGYLRSGREVFKLVAEADADVAAKLLAEIEKENYAELLAMQNPKG